MKGWLELLPLSPEQRQSVAADEDPSLKLLENGWCNRRDILRVAGQLYNCPTLALGRYQPDPAAVKLLSETQARRVRSLPLFTVGSHLYLAVSDPDNLQAQDFVAQLTGLIVDPIYCLPRDIDEAINRHLLNSEQSHRVLDSITAEVKEDKRLSTRSEMLEDRDVPTVKLVDHILSQAIRLGASDLHLEAFPDKVLLRYRIDGHLREYPAPPVAIYNALVSRIKISSKLDIAERRLPQDGRGSIEIDDKKYDLRVSIIPNLHGEGIVIRILNPHAVSLDLKTLGFEPNLLARYQRILARPHGVILVTGPTGSGKSTTLYATLHQITDLTKKVITLEDPVEYQLPNVTQIQVHPDIGYTFAQGLRAVLRHDPDIVLVGEIRDLESAQIAIRAALTGHQMFSTLHTNDAPQAITRLIDMGVPFYQLQAALSGVLAQRLVRKLCPACKRPSAAPGPGLEALGIPASSSPTVYEPVGCKECNHVGYKGRIGVHELLDFTPDLRRLQADQAPQIAELSRESGALLPMSQSLAHKVSIGVTSLEECLQLLNSSSL